MQNKVTLAVLSAAVVGVGGIVANASAISRMQWRALPPQREIANVVADAVEAKVPDLCGCPERGRQLRCGSPAEALKEAVEACIATLSAGAKKYIEKASGGDIEATSSPRSRQRCTGRSPA